MPYLLRNNCYTGWCCSAWKSDVSVIIEDTHKVLFKNCRYLSSFGFKIYNKITRFTLTLVPEQVKLSILNLEATIAYKYKIIELYWNVRRSQRIWPTLLRKIMWHYCIHPRLWVVHSTGKNCDPVWLNNCQKGKSTHNWTTQCKWSRSKWKPF